MQRIFNRTAQLALDLFVLAGAYITAFLLRFEGTVPAGHRARLVLTLGYVVGFQYALLVTFGVTRVAWRYVSLGDMGRVIRATTLSMLVLCVGRVLVGRYLPLNTGAGLALIPYGIILMDSVLVFLGVTGVRVLRRQLAERTESATWRPSPTTELKPSILIGAGRGGSLVAKEIAGRPDLGILAVGFLDDDPVKLGTIVQGLPVLGTTADLARVCKARGATQALVTLAAASGAAIRRIKELCDEAAIGVKIIPGVFEIVGGTVNLSRIRDVAIEDLLRRDQVLLDQSAVTAIVRSRTVLVSGAGGSIGSEICRQVCNFAPTKLLLLEQAENPLFHIERELRAAHPDIELVPCIADICDEVRLEQVFATHAPDVVFHAAAHKHVPLMEANPGEALKNNVFGTKGLADASDRHGASEFVMISTDKAVNPTSVMGVSKRVAEIYIQSLSSRSKTKYVAVRFGNVLGSAGSVVPIFREQLANGGPITITHPDMRRYFMTIPEATQLVLEAASIGRGGEIFILDMGEPVKIVDLARDLIALSGLREGDDIDIVFTGLRPGEKLFEELSTAEEAADRTRNPKVFTGRIKPHAMEHVLTELALLRTAAISGDPDRVRVALSRLVPEYTPSASTSIGATKEPSPGAASKALRAAEESVVVSTSGI